MSLCISMICYPSGVTPFNCAAKAPWHRHPPQPRALHPGGAACSTVYCCPCPRQRHTRVCLLLDNSPVSCQPIGAEAKDDPQACPRPLHHASLPGPISTLMLKPIKCSRVGPHMRW